MVGSNFETYSIAFPSSYLQNIPVAERENSLTTAILQNIPVAENSSGAFPRLIAGLNFATYSIAFPGSDLQNISVAEASSWNCRTFQ